MPAGWLALPHSRRPLRRLAVFCIAVVRATVRLSSACFELTSLLDFAAPAAFVLSLLPGLHSPLLQLLDDGTDGKLSCEDVLDSAARLVLHFSRGAACTRRGRLGLLRKQRWRRQQCPPGGETTCAQLYS